MIIPLPKSLWNLKIRIELDLFVFRCFSGLLLRVLSWSGIHRVPRGVISIAGSPVRLDMPPQRSPTGWTKCRFPQSWKILNSWMVYWTWKVIYGWFRGPSFMEPPKVFSGCVFVRTCFSQNFQGSNSWVPAMQCYASLQVCRRFAPDPCWGFQLQAGHVENMVLRWCQHS